MTTHFNAYLNSETSIAPLVVLRVLFGFIMAVSIARFFLNGWVYELYIKPQFYFSYYGFEWVKPLGPTGMYAVFLLMFLAALGIMLGCWYRISSVLFFLSFTYVELIDKTNYLNHYYFVSLVSFLLILVPAERNFSIDALRNRVAHSLTTPTWTVDVFKLQLAIVYIFAGLAKLNAPWLLDAMPLRIWLPAQSHLPIIGNLMGETWLAYVFSWAGALYDLLIVFFLFNRRTRVPAYMVVIIFHMITWWLFPIGMFPFVMILSTLIFFSSKFHQRLIFWMTGLVAFISPLKNSTIRANPFQTNRRVYYVLAIFFLFQFIMPLRHFAYPGNLFWTEEGYRFSWRVMLMEKAGNVVFHVKDTETNRAGDIMPADFLTPVQEKMMSTQPDMILQFAHFLGEKLKQEGVRDPEVRAEVYVTLNGSGSRKFIDDKIDLTKVQESFRHKEWVLPHNPDQR